MTGSLETDDPTTLMHRLMPFTALLGATALRAEPHEVALRLDWDESRCTTAGLLHGGALMALADAAGGWCAFLNLPDGATGTATVTSATNFLRPVTSGACRGRGPGAARRPQHDHRRHGGARRGRETRGAGDTDSGGAALSPCVTGGGPAHRLDASRGQAGTAVRASSASRLATSARTSGITSRPNSTASASRS
ncbi:hypothetical protein GCM10010464_66190 [Pseudonocardia yunnanensis]